MSPQKEEREKFPFGSAAFLSRSSRPFQSGSYKMSIPGGVADPHRLTGGENHGHG
jgi:hypothetical protein